MAVMSVLPTPAAFSVASRAGFSGMCRFCTAPMTVISCSRCWFLRVGWRCWLFPFLLIRLVFLNWSSMHVVNRLLSQGRYMLFVAPGQLAGAKTLDATVQVGNWTFSEKTISADVVCCADNQLVTDEAVL